jgi:hypothetical protein
MTLQLCVVDIIQQFCVCAYNCLWSKRSIKVCKNLQIVGHFYTQIFPCNSYVCGWRIGTPKYVWSRQLWTQLIKFLTNCETQLVMLGVDNSGPNWYTWSRRLGMQLIQFLDRGTQLIHVKQTPWDSTDTVSWPRDATLTSPSEHVILLLLPLLIPFRSNSE